MVSSEILPEKLSFPDAEIHILELWDKIRAFETSLDFSKGRKEFTFYDGPPFATGLPHYGHLLAGTLKDIVCRFAHQTGHHVERRFGWDCHGVPIECEINKRLTITSREQVLEMGIAKYNDHCRSIVTTYVGEWETFVRRIGRWIDMKNDYKTMEPWYMESVWNVFKTMFNKGLVYRGFKILPFSFGVNTPLSNFEANLAYREVPDPSVTVTFPLVDDPDTSFCVWTTTPWTLPSNLALCVNPNLDYVKLRDVASGKNYIVCESRICHVYPLIEKKGYKGGEFEILENFKGVTLSAQKYVPLFEHFADWNDSAFQVLVDPYVSADTGTGVVHQAPAFGEDDYRVCLAAGIIGKTDVPCPLDDSCRFTDQVPEFKGMNVKEADDHICKALKVRGRLIHKGTIVHSYPFCYRSGTPLIYRAVPSWFIAVERIRDNIVANNLKTYWVPAFVKEKRFHNWLVDARDWAISRNRFWGTPLPLWVSDDYEETICVGSIEELYALSGVRVTDLHRDSVDGIVIPSKSGKGKLKRVDEVFDCWFESGSMPYAQQHYPFENKEKFERNFPADFVAEGLDQTRGWFYTLMVVSTALFDCPPFKNLVANGLVLAEDGKKMSKSLRNYPDPAIVIAKHGADALRLFLINSPVVRAEPLRFKEAGVQGVVKDVFLPWYNAMRFFEQNVMRLEQVSGGCRFTPDEELAYSSTNVMDSWILAALQGLVKFVREEMEAYRLYTVVPRLLNFINDLTNWYVRLNRKRLKGIEGDEAAVTALSALYHVLYSLVKLMSPFTPFLTEYMYQFLRKIHPQRNSKDLPGDAEGKAESVHYLMVPTPDVSKLNPEAEKRMNQLQAVIEMGRILRERRSIPLKNPVKNILIVCKDSSTLDALRNLQSYLYDELNMRTLEFSNKEHEWCSFSALPDNKRLGRRLGKDFAAVKKHIMVMSPEDVDAFVANGQIEVVGHVITRDELTIKREFKGDASRYVADVTSDGSMLVVMDVREDEDLKLQGIAREFINRVQKMRKKARLSVQDEVSVYFEELGASGVILRALESFPGMIQNSLRQVPAPMSLQPEHAVAIIDETFEIAGSSVKISVTRPAVLFADNQTLEKVFGKDTAFVEDVKTFVSTMKYEDVAKMVEADGGVSVRLGIEAVRLARGKELFMRAAEKVKAERLKDHMWMLHV